MAAAVTSLSEELTEAAVRRAAREVAEEALDATRRPVVDEAEAAEAAAEITEQVVAALASEVAAEAQLQCAEELSAAAALMEAAVESAAGEVAARPDTQGSAASRVRGRRAASAAAPRATSREGTAMVCGIDMHTSLCSGDFSIRLAEKSRGRPRIL